MFIKRSELPVVKGGSLAGTPWVSIKENGQVGFSASLTKLFKSNPLAVLDWDEKTRALSITAVGAPPKGMVKEDLFKLSYGKKSGGAYFAAASLCRMLKYDYAKAGSQTFQAVGDEKAGRVTFTLPAETPAPRPKVTRQRKPKAAPVPTTGQATTGPQPVGTQEAPLPELVEA